MAWVGFCFWMITVSRHPGHQKNLERIGGGTGSSVMHRVKWTAMFFVGSGKNRLFTLSINMQHHLYIRNVASTFMSSYVVWLLVAGRKKPGVDNNRSANPGKYPYLFLIIWCIQFFDVTMKTWIYTCKHTIGLSNCYDYVISDYVYQGAFFPSYSDDIRFSKRVLM